MLDSRPASITLSVPKSTDITNRIITFKDLFGSASNSTIILVTQTGDTFEDGTFSTIMSNAYQTVNLYAGQPGKWLNIGATGGGGDSAGLTTVSNNLTTVSNTVAAARFPFISTNTISTNQINSSNICNAGWISNNGVFSNITAGAFFQNTSNTGTLGVAGLATMTSISNSGLISTLGLNVGALSSINISTVNLTAGFISTLNLGATRAYITNLFVGTEDFGSDLTASSNITQTGGTTILNGLSVSRISTSFIVASNISVASMSTTYGFFSTISTGSVYGRFIGDGSLLTNLPVPRIPSTLSTLAFFTSSISTANITSPQGYISSLVVDSLSFSLSNSFIVMGDIITTSVSTIQTFTSTLTTNNLRVGTVSSLSYISFPGLQQGYNQSVIAEQSTGTGLQELLVFRGSSASDRIRMQTTGSIVFEPGVSARTFPSVPSNVTPAMIINSSSNVGIGTATPGVALDVVGAGRFTAVSTNTLSTNQVNSSNICNAGWISNNGVFSNITAGAFFQATSNTTTLGVGGILTAASNISQTGGTTILSGLSVNTISTNQVNSSNICNAGWISNNGVFSNITAGAFFQATSNTGTLGVGGILTAASNITQNGGTTVLSGLSVNTISTNTINGNLGRFTDISTNTISTNIVTGSVVGRLPANTLAASVSPLAVVNGNAYLSFSPQIEFQYNSGGYKHFMGSRHQGDTANSFGNAVDFWLYSATTGGSNASTTPGTCNVNTMSVTAQGVGIFNNSPTLALDVTGTGRFQMLSTQQIYVSSISSGSVYGQFIGDGSLLTGLPSGGSGGLPISTNNTTLTDPASIIIKTPNTSYFYADYTNLTNYITISNYGAANGDYINIVNTGNSGTPATFQVLDGSTGASTIIRYIYPGHAGVVAYSGGQWWPL
jgi:hypothetical protein